MKEELEGLKAALAKLPRGTSRRYPAALRGQIASVMTKLRAQGKSWAYGSKVLGIGLESLQRICSGQAEKRAGFVAVKVASTATDGFTLHGPAGVHVRGLSADDVAAILRRLA